MSVWYSKADEELVATIKEVMKKHHEDKHIEGVTVDCLLAHTDRIDGTAIKSRGTYALAYIRITSLMERVMGMADALMIIDHASMQLWKENRLRAVIDHELEHIQLIREKKNNQPRRDDHDRPMLGIKQHDYQFGWFEAPVKHYGYDAVEYDQAQQLVNVARWIPQTLPGFDVGGAA